MNEQNETKKKTEQNTVATFEEVKIEPLADNDLEKVVGGIKQFCTGVCSVMVCSQGD